MGEQTTAIRGGWLVAWSGDGHEILEGGTCVLRGDEVVHVGGDYDGPVDREIDATGCLISPGLLSTHLHANNNAKNCVFPDVGRPESRAQNYLNWQALTKGATRFRPDPATSISFGLSQVLRSGVTTVVEIDAGHAPDAFCDAVDAVGIRAFSGLTYRNVKTRSLPDGRLDHDWDDGLGREGFVRALEFADGLDAHALIEPILCPGHTDTCSDELLEWTAAEVEKRGIPATIHAAINPLELGRTLDRHRLTPIQLLDRFGLLREDVILGHAVFLSSHSWSHYKSDIDLQLLGDAGASVSHSPLKYLHMGVHLESLRRYLDAGVNVTIGTDLAPSDMVSEMRYAMLMGRLADGNLQAVWPRDVFDAVTVRAARALKRDDLGRLTPGARADVAIFDLRKLHFGAVYDPIASLVDSGAGSDARDVFVNGRQVVEDGHLTGVDESDLLDRVQADGQRIFDDVPNWIWGGRALTEVNPPAYPMSNASEGTAER